MFLMDTDPKERQATKVDGGIRKAFRSKSRKVLEPLIEYVLGLYYNGVDNFGNQIEGSSREESCSERGKEWSESHEKRCYWWAL